MVLFIILGAVVVVTVPVLGFLFYMLAQEGKKKEEEKAVPVTDLAELKKELANQFFEPSTTKVLEKDSELIPVYEAKVNLPVEEAQSIVESSSSSDDEAYKKRAQQLEDELLDISKKADVQSDEARQMIVNLSKENQVLKGQQESLQQAQEKLIDLEKQASDLRSENVNLQSQLESTDAKVHFLENEMAAVKVQMGEELTRANEMIAELNHGKETLISTFKADPDEALRQELETLKREDLQWKQKYEELQKSQQELDGLNDQLTEKNESLQYELIKARAQSSGLERVSFNYKNQLEESMNKVNALQVTYDHLSKIKEQIETELEGVKLQNEDLVKKDHLSQFEIEKYRARLQGHEQQSQQ